MQNIELLAKTYAMDSEIVSFLQDKPKVVKAMLDAIQPIYRAFGHGTKLSTEMLRECCSQMLFVKIETPHKADVALEQLEQFDNDWWFNIPHEIHNNLEFSLEFV